MVPALKEEPKVETSRKQTEEFIMNYLQEQGRSLPAAQTILNLARESLRNPDVEIPREVREHVDYARNELTFMPKLIDKGYAPEEAHEIIDAARYPHIEIPFSSGRIQDYDVSVVKDQIAYLKEHPDADRREVTAGMLFRGPSTVPSGRERVAEKEPTEQREEPAEERLAGPSPEEAEQERFARADTTLGKKQRESALKSIVPEKIEEVERHVDEVIEIAERGEEAPRPAAEPKPEVAEAPAEEEIAQREEPPPVTHEVIPGKYAYDVEMRGNKYKIVFSEKLNEEDLELEAGAILGGDPSSILSLETPEGRVLEGKELQEYIKYNFMGMYAAATTRPGAVKVTSLGKIGELDEEVAQREEAPPKAEEIQTPTEYAYNIDMRGASYQVTLNVKLDMRTAAGDLVNILKNAREATVVSIRTPEGRVLKGDELVTFLSSFAAQYEALYDLTRRTMREGTLYVSEA